MRRHFTPDGATLFLSVQHPSEDAETLDKAQSLWPDFKDGQPPRPSVVAIRRKDGQPVGAYVQPTKKEARNPSRDSAPAGSRGGQMVFADIWAAM